MATRVVTYKLMPTLNSYGWGESAFQAAVRATWLRFYESIANVRFVEVPWSKSANVSINCKEIYIGNWQHARGTVSGTTTWLHSGWIAPGHSPYTSQGFWWQAFSSLEGMQQVLAHELGHHRVLAWGGNSAHCRNGTCTFSINAGPMWCAAHLVKIQRKFGARAIPGVSESSGGLCPETCQPKPSDTEETKRGCHTGDASKRPGEVD